MGNLSGKCVCSARQGISSGEMGQRDSILEEQVDDCELSSFLNHRIPTVAGLQQPHLAPFTLIVMALYIRMDIRVEYTVVW